ncbi:MAG: hypothetical protein KJ064_00160 [Anaerolineae bacterium]|nr:hypothetical protein [Anaerolineae bacterium]
MKKILLIALMLLLAACGQDTSTNPQPISDLALVTTSANVTLQENRVVLTVWKGAAWYNDLESLRVRAYDPQNQVAWEGEAANYSDYDVPYWVAYPQFNMPGFWRLEAELKTHDGQSAVLTLWIKVKETDSGITAGMPAPRSRTLTVHDDLPIARITSDITPNDALYQQTIAEAVTSGKPSLIVFASPGLCSNRICTPVVDHTIDALVEKYGTQLNTVHVEIYDLATAQYVPAMEAWGLDFEPWTYLVDADGIVAARFDGPVSVTELAPTIDALLRENS